MPAVMVLRQRDNPVPDSPGKWLAGEIVVIVEEDHKFGFQEMPINPQGSFSVSQINGQDVSTFPLYASVQCTDAGTVTSGTGPDVPVEVDDILVLQADDSWTNFGPMTEVPNGFGHIRISDRTVEEVNIYLESYNKKLEYTSDQFDPATGNRRFTTTNVRVSASGNNGFTTQGINDAIAAWNDEHPDNQVTLNDTDNLTFFQCDGIMPNTLFDEWKENTQEVALDDYYARRRWYINQAGRTALEANNWVISGTASQVSSYLRDGLLD